MTRRGLATLAALAVVPLAAAGCGSGDGGASSPLDESLSYLPKNAPLVVSFDTDLNGGQYKDLDRLLRRFPLSGQIKEEIVESIEEDSSGVDFDQDIKPLLGNEVVIGATDVRSLQSDDEDFVGAVKAKDKGKLEQLLKKEGARGRGEQNGAKLYESKDGDDTFAIKDDVLVLASSRPVLEKALERRDGDDHLTEDDLYKSVEGLPKSPLARVYADLGAIIKADPGSADALKSEWVSSLETLGVTASAASDGLKLDFKVKTGGDLSDADVPLATGDQAPGVISQPGRLSFGLRGVNQVLDFAQTTAKAVSPADFAEFETAKQQIESRLGVDLDSDLIQQLDGDTSVVVGVDGRFGARAELKDPSTFEDSLRKAGRVLPSVAGSLGGPGARITPPRGGRGLYEYSAPGDPKIVFGVVKDVFVVAGNRSEAAALAAREPEAVPGAKGAFAFQADAESVARQAIAQIGAARGGLNLGGSLFTGPLGEVTGSMQAETSGITGSFKLGVE